MSGCLKTLFDRFTDLLSNRDPAERGQQLAGRSVWMLAVGVDPELPDGFETPFRATATYLEIKWRGGLYLSTRDEEEMERRLDDFARLVEAAAC